MGSLVMSSGGVIHFDDEGTVVREILQGPPGPVGGPGPAGPAGPIGPMGTAKEIGYAETNVNFSVTTTAGYDVTNTVIPGLMVQITGEGTAVEIEFFAPGVYSSTGTNLQIMPFITINGATQGAVITTQRSTSTTEGPPALIKRRMVLAKGTTYTFRAGVTCEAAARVLWVTASDYARAYLSVMAR